MSQVLGFKFFPSLWPLTAFPIPLTMCLFDIPLLSFLPPVCFSARLGFCFSATKAFQDWLISHAGLPLCSMSGLASVVMPDSWSSANKPKICSHIHAGGHGRTRVHVCWYHLHHMMFWFCYFFCLYIIHHCWSFLFVSLRTNMWQPLQLILFNRSSKLSTGT